MLYENKKAYTKPPKPSDNKNGGGGLLKALSAAVFAGCIALIPQNTFAADFDPPESTLQKLHNSGAMIPGTDSVYPEGVYNLVEVSESDSGLPNVVKYYNPNELDDSVHYYRVDLKYSEYGSGDSVKYYKWTKDEYGVKLVETSDSSEAVLTLKFNPDETIVPIVGDENNPLNLVNGDYVVKDIKKAIVSAQKINSVSSKFMGSTIQVTSDDRYAYSAVMTEADASISDVNSTFAGNTVTSDTQSTIYGTLVKSIGTIDRLYSEFVGNSLTATAGVNGGLVEASGIGTISEISSDFMLNRVVTGKDIEGAMIGNDGTINTIRDSKFLNNYGVSTGGTVYGGAVYNNNTIGSVNDSVFIGNYAKSLTKDAYGGAIYNKLVLREISNTIFRDNYAEAVSGKALGGAIYTHTDLKFSANNGKLTEFTNNYILNNGVKENQAIYAASKEVSLVFSAYDRGRILLNDMISGVSGYKVSLTGDDTGKISLYNGINNASVTVSGVNLDTADGKFFDYNFLSLNSYDSAKYGIDINFSENKSDKFVVGANSQGTILLSELNILGDMPASDSIVQILSAPDTISVALTQDLIDKYTKTVHTGSSIINDTIAEETLWTKKYNQHIIDEYLTTGIRAVASEGRNNADSIEYYHTTSEKETLQDWGDTFALVNREKTGNRKFIAVSANDTYTMSEDLGTTAGGGTFTVSGLTSGDKRSTIDANGHTMFELSQAGTKVDIQSVNIINFAQTDGAVLNISQGSSAVLTNANITGNSLSNGIVNNGTLSLATVQNSTTNLNTSIIGDGQLNIGSGNTTTGTNILNLNDGASIAQNNIHMLGGSYLTLSDTGTITADSMLMDDWSILSVVADNLKCDVTNNSYNSAWGSLGIWLKGGTLNVNIYGAGGSTIIQGDVTLNGDIYGSRTRIDNNSTLTTIADHIKGAIDKYQGNGTLNLTGGTLSKSVTAYNTNITGDMTVTSTGAITGRHSTISIFVADGKHVVLENAGSIKDGYVSLGDNSTIELKSGTLVGNYQGDITGTGTAIISGNVTSTAAFFSNLDIRKGASLTISGNHLNSAIPEFINNGTLKLNGGTLNQEVTGGDGLIQVVANATSNVKLTQQVQIDSGKNLYIAAQNIGHDITNNGTLHMRDGVGEEGFTISGSGLTHVESGHTVTNNAQINQRIQRDGTLITNADLIGGDVTGSGTLELTGGTLNKTVTNGTVRVQDNNSVISNSAISSTINLLTGGSLTISADNIKGDVNIYANSNLYIGDGTLDKTLLQTGTANIVGNVKTTNKRIDSKIVVADTGTLTINTALINNDSVTNHGNLYLTGNLNKTIAGADGTTFINEDLGITQNAVIEGILDLNNGVLSSDNSYSNYNLGTVINSGTLKFGVNIAGLTNDKFVLNENSTGIFNISSSTINFTGSTENLDHTFQVLYGDSGSKLVLADNDKEFDIALKKEREDDLRKADVYFDEEFNLNITRGSLHGEIELATSATATGPDSIRVTTGEIKWDPEEQVRADLLRALNQYLTSEDRHFRFRTADDEYLAIDNLGGTATGQINIHGVYDAEADKRSVINMDTHSGFSLGNGAELNIYDTEFKNASSFLIKSKNAEIGTITTDEDGNKVISGGIVNSAFTNNTVNNTSNGINGIGAVLQDTGSVISQIKDSVFKDNTASKSTTDIYSSSVGGGGVLSFDGSQVGSKTTAQGGIIGSLFENNNLNMGGGNTSVQGGAVALKNQSFISQIKDSTFRNNSITGSNADNMWGGALYLSNSSQIGTKDTNLGGIINTVFEGNELNGRGGAIYLGGNGNYISNIVDSTFRNNNTKSSGGAIYLNDAQIGTISNTTFENNTTGNNGGALHLTGNHSRIDNILDSTFTGNSASSQAGAILVNDNGYIDLISGTTFDKNKAGVSGSAIYALNGTINQIKNSHFLDNEVVTNTNSSGGIIEINSNSRINLIADSEFKGNKLSGPNNGAGAAINNNATIGTISGSLFENNIVNITSGVSYGAIHNYGTINKITDSQFIGNELYGSGITAGAGLMNDSNKTIQEISNLTFKNNFAEGASSANVLGALANYSTINKAENLTFIGNHVTAKSGNGLGGAIGNTGTFTNGIVNATFKDNYVTASSIAKCFGGAIYTGASLKLIANNNFESEISGNYITDGSIIKNEAIWVHNTNTTLTFDSNTGGRFIIKDYISGNGGYDTLLTGDSTGKISLYNSIFNSDVTAEKTNIDTADGNLFDYEFRSLTSSDTAKYQIDIDFVNQKADTFNLANGSSGKMIIDNLNILNGDVDKTTKVQILNSPNSNIQLGLDSSKYNIVDDIVLTCGANVTDTDIFHQQTGYNTSTTKTTNDSITRFIEKDWDTLSVVAASNRNADRTFQFVSDKEYNVIYDVLDSPVAQGSFTIKGLDGAETRSTINLNGNSIFDLANATALQIENTKITGAKDNNVITVSNEDASITINNSYIDGNITGNQHYNITANGQGENVITGVIQNADTKLISGSLAFANQTFADSNDTLNVMNGNVSLSHDSQIDEYQINKLTSDGDAGYSIDMNLNTKQADKIILSDKSSSGIVTIENINFLNQSDTFENFVVQILDTNNNKNIKLDLADELNRYEIKDLSREESDPILNVTKYTDKYNIYVRKGKLCGDIYLATTQTENDSLGVEIKEIWETSREFDRYLGDTLTLVNQADLTYKTFLSDQSTDKYDLTDDLGKTSSGVLNLDGVTADDGEEKSTINLGSHKGFEIGENTTLNINNTRITGNNTDGYTDIITVTDSSSKVNLNGAYIDGNITGTEKFDVTIGGSNTTTISGTVTNADVTLTLGTLDFGKNTFADATSSLTIESGSVNTNNGEIENYNIANLISTDKSKVSIDVDLEQAIADTITVGAGSSGVIVLNELNFAGSLSQIQQGDDYTIQVLKNTTNADIKLQLSESVLSQVNKDIKLGTDHIILSTDTVNPNSLWNDKYWQTEQDLDIYGRIDLATKETIDDSLHLYNLSIVAGEEKHVLGDTLKLLNQLDTKDPETGVVTDRSFTFESAENKYVLKDYLGTTTEGKFNINGVADNDDITITSTIDMNKKTGFGLSNESELTISNMTFENINFKDGSLINVSNENAVVNLDNIYILDTICSNAIQNAGNINLTGGNVILNTGITGKGATNITGADVVFGDGISIIQNSVNVESGSLTMAANGLINGSLNIGENGSVNVHTNSLISAVANDGNLNLTGGTLTQNVSGEGYTNIAGEVINSAKIDNNVDVKSGMLTSSADKITGEINNDAALHLNGTLSKYVTGAGTTTVNETLKLAAGSGFEGELNLNDGSVSTKDNAAVDYNIGKMTGEGSFTIDVDLTSGNPISDKFIVGADSNGTVYIDNINFLPSDEKITEEFKVQVLETNGNSAIQLALNDEISKVDRKVGRTSRDEQDTVLAKTDYKDIYNNYVRGGDVYGNLVVGTSKTENDSLVIKIDNDKTVWDDSRKVTTSMGDTLALWNQLDTNEDKIFTIGDVDTYKVSDSVSGLGETKGTNLTIKGTSESETSKATVDLNGKTGFELNGEQTLTIQDTKLTGSETLVSVSNSNAKINLNNVFIDGNISGSENYKVNISGDGVTTINGKINNANAELTSGGLKFNTDSFADSSLTTVSGNVLLSNNKIENYVINNLDSEKDAMYTIDVDLSGSGSADTITVTGGTGTIVLDTINIVGSIENANTDYTIQILNTPTSDLQLALSQKAEDQLGEDYVIGKAVKIFDDEVKEVTNWKDIYNRFQREDLTYGKLMLADTKTTNDSLGIRITKTVEGEKELVGPLGDTLRLVNNAQNLSLKTFEFDTSSDEYKVSEDLGTTNGKVVINGVLTDGKSSIVNLEEHKGFELIENSKLEVNNTRLTNGADNTIVTAKDSSAEVTLRNSAVDGIITGEKGYTVNLTGDNSYTFDVYNEIQNAKVNIDTIKLDVYNTKALKSSDIFINSGTINLTADERVSDLASKTFTINKSFNLLVDADLKNQTMDKLPSNTTIAGDSYLNVAGINLLSDTEASSVAIPFAYKGFKDNVKYTGSSELSKETQITTAYAPIYKYSIRYENRDDLGYFVFGRGSGSKSSDFNPSVLASPVASQAGSYAAMNESLNYVFEHADTFMLLPSKQRLSMRNANRYAIADSHLSLYRSSDLTNKSGWVHSYANFENMTLHNGPKVDVTSYGTLAGGDGDLIELRNGWATVSTAYVGYNGSSQHYMGVNTYQNGGMLGFTQTFYKNNFFTALTASAGASVGESHTMYGHESFTTLMSGVASKTGYDLELRGGKYIIQPTMIMSYSFINTFDYTNAAGVKIDSNPLHTIQIHPDVKFIANLKNGWQPYAKVGMVWNILNDTKVTADNIRLPEMSIKPYVEYGLGVQKRWADKFTGYFQAMLRNGGRNGIALTGGFRWSLGKSLSSKPQETVKAPAADRKIVKQLTSPQKNFLIPKDKKGVIKHL